MARIDAEVGPGGVRVAPALRRPARRGDHRIVDTADIPEQMGVSTDRNKQLRGWIAQMSREHREVIALDGTQNLDLGELFRKRIDGRIEKGAFIARAAAALALDRVCKNNQARKMKTSRLNA